jgi:uncharacterized membrane-anchored protein
MAKFAESAKVRLATDIEKEIDEARAISKGNQGWDIAFRVGILLLGLAVVVCSGIATSDLMENPKPMSLISTVLAGVSAALSTFAFTDFSFAKRQRVWEKKSNLLRSLHDQLNYSDPDEEHFRKRLDEVRNYGDHSDPDAVV